MTFNGNRNQENRMRNMSRIAATLVLAFSTTNLIACDAYGPADDVDGKALPSCTDGIKNGIETDVDCGGGSCKNCNMGSKCHVNSDCASNACINGVCGTSSDPCKNGVRDANEVDIDCGGACTTRCADTRNCNADVDCASNRCVGGKCAPAVVDSCVNMAKDGDESDIDCGGKQCATCGVGKSCKAHTDCYSNACDLGVAKCSAAVVLSGLKPLVCPNGAFVLIGWVTGPNPTKSTEADGTLRILRNGVIGHVNVSATCDGRYFSWDAYRGKTVKDLGGRVIFDGVDISTQVMVCASTPHTGPGDKIALPMEKYLYGTCPNK